MGKPQHSISGLRGGEVGHTNHFYIKGKVATFPKGKIKVLRNVGGGAYTVYKKIKTKSSGKFRTSIGQAGKKKTCFKVQVPGTVRLQEDDVRRHRLHRDRLTRTTYAGPAPSRCGAVRIWSIWVLPRRPRVPLGSPPQTRECQ